MSVAHNETQPVNRMVVFLTVMVMTVTAVFPVFSQDGSPDDGSPDDGATNGAAGELSVTDVVRRVLEADPDIINSRRSVERAQQDLALTRAGTRPNLNLELTPYSWDQRRVPMGQASEDVRTQSVGAGLTLEQNLPTSGRLNASVSNQTNVVDGETRRVEQEPELSVSVSQPLFVNGRFIGDDVFRAGVRSSEIGVTRSQVSDRLSINGSIRTALSLFVQVGSLRRSVNVLERTIDVLQRQLESAELDRSQGLISDNALLALQVTLNDRREALFDTELALVQAEQNLARVLGMSSLEGAALADGFRNVSVPQVDDLNDAIRTNPQVILQELSVEQSRQTAILDELQDRPRVSLSVRLAPTYPEDRDDDTDVAASFSDLFGSGADVEATVALGVTIPLLSSRERAYRDRIDELSRLQAETNLTDTERGVANQLQTLLTNRRFLTRRVELLELDVEYERRRVENERALLEAGATTGLRVEEVELDLLSRTNELRQVEGDLFLNGVEILSALGEDLAEVFSRPVGR